MAKTDDPSVLVVDDDRNLRVTLSMILADEGYDVLTAQDAQQALDLLDARPVDVVLMDIKMPGMRGDEACAKAKRMRPELPVVMITAHVAEDLAQGALEAGADSIHYKPLDVDRLLRRVAELCTGRQRAAARSISVA